eukprot:TRINITY_DN57442_c0_g1_i1.p1 TRINITY_DN57442_c0_g1~~TRINITY_DN57442_c0_g1_i1.p1  ORF type:complete len:382 (+),score=51.78 TRINITY_DN57442_c0_g1_i1:46-1146(+)
MLATSRGCFRGSVRLMPRRHSHFAMAFASSAHQATPESMKRKRIGTHDGPFHCDEVLGCFLLLQTAAFKHSEIVRTRDPSELNKMDVVLDVGARYEPDKMRFDHHQREFCEVFGHGFATKLSSAGLVYKHFGKEIVASALKLPEDDSTVEKIFLKVYKNFVEAVDGIDNGIDQWESNAPPRYLDSTRLSTRIGKLNPSWNEDSSASRQMEQFQKAMALVGEEFSDAVRFYANNWLPARHIVEEALDQSVQVHDSGKILRLASHCPWKEHLLELEAEHDTRPQPEFCLYEDHKGDWRVQAIPVSLTSFENRCSLPEEWCGLSETELVDKCGIPGSIFVHANGFIGGNKTYEGALAMATAALESASRA